jgi:DNA mismatch endonuclease (patch repair protein)
MERALRKTLRSGRFAEVPEPRSKTMRAIRSRRNRTTEVPFRLGLVRRRIRGWKMHFRIRGTRPDFYFPGQKLAVFIDGCFWHGCPECGHTPKTNASFWRKKIELNKQRDHRDCLSLKMSGIQVRRFWEHEILNNVNGCIEALDLHEYDV